MDVAITGGTGLLGRHLAEHLLDEGHAVRILARRPERVPADLATRVEVVVGDVTDRASLRPLVDGADALVHMAAVVGSGGADLDAFRAVHVEGTASVLREATRAGIRTVVHVSSVGVYGDVDGEADETTPPRPDEDYELTKWEGEEIARALSKELDLDLVVLRPAGIYGRGDRRLFKLFRAVDRKRFVLIGRGENRYHLVHAHDVARAVLTALERAGDEGVRGETFVLADAAPIAIRDLVVRIATVAGSPPPRLRIPLWPVKLLAHLVAAVCRPLGIDPPLYPARVAFFEKERAYRIDKARDQLGWDPEIDLDDGLRRTLDAYRDDGWL